MLSVFSCPSRYTQGKNATQMLGQEMATLGLQGPALIMAGKTAVKMLAETWRETLGNAGISYEVHTFGGECSRAEIERITDSAKKLKGETIHNEPFEVRPDMVTEAILAADATGRTWKSRRASC